MALTLKDRVLETAAAPGTGAVTLLGAVTGYQTFSAAIGNGNTCYYTIADQSGSNWEVGIGSYATSGNTLTRTTVLSSSNAGSTVNFASGTQNVFVTYPAEEAVYSNGTNIVGPSGIPLAVSSGGTGLTTLTSGYIPYGNGTSAFSSSSSLYFDGSHLGIGTSSPSSFGTLVVRPASGSGIIALQNSTPTNSLLITNTGSQSSIIVNDTVPLIFGTNSIENMRLTSAGYLGIGTSSPSSALQVIGDVRINSVATSITGLPIYAKQTNVDQRGIWVEASATDSEIRLFCNGTVGGIATSYSSTGSYLPITFSTSGSEQMRLDSSGNLGLGVTPSAWFSGTPAMQYKYYGSIWNASDSTFHINENAYYNGSNWVYLTSTQASNYYQGSGTHNWRIAPSGTAGNAITFTQAMTLDNSGNLGVGTTATAGARLAVYGGSLANGGNNLNISSYLTSGRTGTYDANSLGSIHTYYDSTSLEMAVGVTSGYVSGISVTGQNATLFPGTIRFTTGSSERARFDVNGNLLVGTTSNGGAKLKVIGNSTTICTSLDPNSTTATTLEMIVGSNNTTQAAMYVYSSSNSNFNFRVWSNGNTENRNNSYGAISDIKLKENIVDATPKLNDLCKVKVRNYNLIGEQSKQIGVIAQELEEVFPSMIDETADKDAEGNNLGTTTKSVKYSVFVPMLIKAVQELSEEVNQLKQKLGV